jgi:hypothetical protein
MSEETSLLEIKKMIDDLAEILDILHVEITEIKQEVLKLKTELKENIAKNNDDKVNFMHG